MKEQKLLNHGFVRLVSSMGDDAAIVQAARVSYGNGTKSVNDDRNLIRYLMRHRHTTPFEMVVFKFHIKCPIFIARQWQRHRTASINEISGRYSVLPDEYYTPEILHEQSASNKQGSGKEHEEGKLYTELLHGVSYEAFKAYNYLVKKGVAREEARIVLPLSTYTEFYWQMDLHNLLHFLKLRLDSHAQYEIREYAQAIADMVREVVPCAYEAFEDYVLNAVTFSAGELRALNITLVNNFEAIPLSKREKTELRTKLGRLK
jgi:thymidylate synthase (FAD)